MDYNKLSDRELLKKCIEDNPDAGDFFVEKYSNLIYSSIHKTLKRYSANCLEDDIADMHNNIFESLFKDDRRKLKQFRGENNCTLATWLGVIAMNNALNFISRNKVHCSLDDNPAQDTFNIYKILGTDSQVLDQLIDAEEKQLLEIAISELKANDILLIKHYSRDNRKPEEIAELMNITTSTVYSKISRIKEKLKKILENIDSSQ